MAELADAQVEIARLYEMLRTQADEINRFAAMVNRHVTVDIKAI